MQQAYIVTGSLTDRCTVTLDEALPVNQGKVRLVVEVLEPGTKPSYDELMVEIRDRQRQLGFVPPTREEVDAYLKAERNSWDD